MELLKQMKSAETTLNGEKDATKEKHNQIQNMATKRAQLKKKNEELKLRSQHHENEYSKEKARRDKLEETLTKKISGAQPWRAISSRSSSSKRLPPLKSPQFSPSSWLADRMLMLGCQWATKRLSTL